MSSNATPPPGAGKNRRPCPALNGFISPADCGAQRGSKLTCPPHCTFYPFGTDSYQLWLKVDENWTVKATNYVVRHLGLAGFQKLAKQMTVPMEIEALQVQSAILNANYQALFIARNPAGQTLADQWEAQQWAGLNNDERVMMHYRRHTLPTMLEVQRVLDGRAIQCVDLFEPDRAPFVVYDTGAAASVFRFSRVFTWLTHYPHFSRIGPGALQVPYTIWPLWREEIEQRVRRAAAGRPTLTFKQYLAETLMENIQLMHDLGEAYRQRAFHQMDLCHCVAIYSFQGSVTEVEAILQGKPEFQAEEPPAESILPKPRSFYGWYRREEAAALGKESSTGAARPEATPERPDAIGTVRVYADHLVLEGFSKAKYASARQLMDQYFGALLHFEKESITNLAEVLRERELRGHAIREAEEEVYGEAAPEETEPAGPPESTEHPSPGETTAPETATVSPELQQRLLQKTQDDHYRKFLEQPVPALDDWTPRAAAKDLQMRGRLRELMKEHIHQLERRNRESGARLNMDWALEELGLADLK